MDLTELPPVIRESAERMSETENETLIGWKAITDYDRGSSTAKVKAYMVITNKGYYEIDTDGYFIRAGVLHPF